MYVAPLESAGLYRPHRPDNTTREFIVTSRETGLLNINLHSLRTEWSAILLVSSFDLDAVVGSTTFDVRILPPIHAARITKHCSRKIQASGRFPPPLGVLLSTRTTTHA